MIPRSRRRQPAQRIVLTFSAAAACALLPPSVRGLLPPAAAPPLLRPRSAALPLRPVRSAAARRPLWSLRDDAAPDEIVYDPWVPSFLRGAVLPGGVPLTPSVAAIATVYLVEGGLGLSRLAQQFILKDELGMGPAEIDAWAGLLVLPWTIKPIYGFLSDTVPIFGYKRRGYLVLMGLVGSAAYLGLSQDYFGFAPFAGTMGGVIALLLLSSASVAVCDVVADGIVVELSRGDTDLELSRGDTDGSNTEEDGQNLSGALQSLCWGCAAGGSLASAYYSGSLIESVGPRGVFGYAAFLPLAVAIIAIFIDEEPVGRKSSPQGDAPLAFGGGEDAPEAVVVSEGENGGDGEDIFANLKQQTELLWSALSLPSIYKPVIFIFLWRSTPTADGAFLFFLTNDLGMGPEFLGRIRLACAAASLVGVFVYQNFLRTVPIKTILFWTSLISAPLGLTQLLLITHANRALGIPDGAFVFGDDVALTVLGQVAFMPTLVLAARLCPPGIESTLFATLMSVNNFASTVGTEVGAALTKTLGVTGTDFSNLGLLTVICNVSSLYPLFFIGWLDEVGKTGEISVEEEMGNIVEIVVPHIAGEEVKNGAELVPQIGGVSKDPDRSDESI